MRTRPARKDAGALRRCATCLAEFRERSDATWRLEYVDPDLFHRARRSAGSPPLPLLRARSWEDWSSRPPEAGGGRSNPTPRADDEAPPDLPAGEVVRHRFSGVRVVNPNSHHPRHSDGPTGTLWVTDRSLLVTVGAFRWETPRSEVRRCRDAAGMLEILAGPTDEPIYLLAPSAREIVALLT